MSEMNSIVAVYDTQIEAESAVRELRHSGFDLTELSVLGREHESGEHTLGYYHAGGRMRYCGARGAFWNDLWELLDGAGHFAIPGLGRVLVAGPLALAIVNAVANPAIDDLNAVGASLLFLSIPRGSIVRYEAALKMQKLLLVGRGSMRAILKCKDVLRNTQPRETNIHFTDESVLKAA